MDSQPKPEPGSPLAPPYGGDAGDDAKLMNMSMDLISKLQAMIDAKAHLKGEVEKMRKDIYLLHESRKFVELVEWGKRQVEEELEEQCENRKKAEQSLDAAKKKKQEDGVTIGELRSKICSLEEELEKCYEQCEKGKRAEEWYVKSLEVVMKKEQKDGDMIAELKSKNSESQGELKRYKEQCAKGKKAEERYEELLGAVKKKEQEDRDMIAKLRSKICQLVDGQLKDDEYWKRKYMDLNERALKLEKDIELLMSGGDTNGIHAHGRESGNNNAASTPCQRNGDTNAFSVQFPSIPNKDASGSRKLGLRTNVEIEDSAHDGDAVCTSKGALGEKETTCQFVADNGHPDSLLAVVQQKDTPSVAEDVTGMPKRKFGSRGFPCHFLSTTLDGFDITVTSSSSSESSESDTKQLWSCHRITVDKSRKT